MAGNKELKSQLSIRAFCASDQDEARLLILNGLGEHFDVIDESLNSDVDDISSHYLSATGNRFVVAVLDEMLVGTAALVVESADTGRIVRVSVEKRYRRLGIGKELVNYLLQRACQQGLQRILVETNHDWQEAVCFYTSLGFVEYDRDQEIVHMCLCLT